MVASPRARMLAGELGVDLAAVKRTAGDGVIARGAVEQYAAAARRETKPGKGKGATEGWDELEAGNLHDLARTEPPIHDQLGVAQQIGQQNHEPEGCHRVERRQDHLRDEVTR